MSRAMKTQTAETGRAATNVWDNPWLEVVRQQVGSLRFGVVQIVVHEARVVQVERTERVRFDQQTIQTTQTT